MDGELNWEVMVKSKQRLNNLFSITKYTCQNYVSMKKIIFLGYRAFYIMLPVKRKDIETELH